MIMCIECEGENVLLCVLDGLNMHYSDVDRCWFRADIVHQMVFTYMWGETWQ